MEDVVWTAHIELLSPLHIGSGEVLLEGIDWLEHGGFVYVADPKALLEAVFDRAGAEGRSDREVARAVAGMTLEDLGRAGYLTAGDFGPASPLFRYRLRGKPATNQILEQVKDVYGRPYLPGSSLKGALRTVLAVGGATARSLDVQGMVIAELDEVEALRRKGERVRPDRRRAGQPIERALFAPGVPKDRKRDVPHYDLLRALRVGDGEPVGAEHLRLERVHVYPTARRGSRQGLDLDVEALAPGTRLEVSIRIEGYLFGEQAERRLRLGRLREWLEALPRWGRVLAGQRIADEVAFFRERPDGSHALSFYRRLMEAWERLGEDEFLLQVGWGGGWPSKTFGRLLQKDAPAFERIVGDYHMTKEKGRQPGDPFPRSRHLVRVGEHPALPLGWLRVRLEKAE